MEYFRSDDFSDGYASSDSSYDREELEIALYSQIHFEENIEFTEDFNEDCVNNNLTQYVIDVQGNEGIGFIANKTNADLILNESIDNKYENTLSPIDSCTKRKDLVDAKGSRKKNDKVESSSKKLSHKLKRGGDAKCSRRIQQLEKSAESLAVKEVRQSAKIKAILRSTTKCKGKLVRSTAEQLILGSESDSEDDVDDDPDDEIMSISSSNGSVVVMDTVSVEEQSDSDADSLDIVLGESDNEENDIQMNVESPSPRYTYRKMSGEEPVVGDLDKQSDDGEDWVINKDDSFKGSLRSPARYYKPIRCHNCNKVGHLSRNCPEPKKVVICAMCAEPGHICRNCPQAVCYNCEVPGHDRRECRAPRRNMYYQCYRCNMLGHDQRQCPENWRQYHVTVTPGKVQPFLKQTKRKRSSCYNCGDEGHIGYECEEERMNKFTRVYSPFISRYQSLSEIKNKVRKFGDIEEWSSKRSKSDDRGTKEKRIKITFDTKTADRNINNREPVKLNAGNKVRRFHDQKQERKHAGRNFDSREPVQLETGNHVRRFLDLKQERKHEGRNFDSREPAQLGTGNKHKRFVDQKQERKHAGQNFDSREPAQLGTGNKHKRIVDQKQVGKQSPFIFADIVKNNSNEKSGRNNFDKLQSASLDKKKQRAAGRHRKRDKTAQRTDSQTPGTHNTNRVVGTDSRQLNEDQSKGATKSKTTEQICNVIVTLNSADMSRVARTSTPENATKTEKAMRKKRRDQVRKRKKEKRRDEVRKR